MNRRDFLLYSAAVPVALKLKSPAGSFGALERAQATEHLGAPYHGSAALPGLATISGGTYTGPYALTASSEISEDYFVTADVLLNGPSDKIVPYAASDGSVNAIVLSGGVLSMLYRDPTQPSGWSYEAIVDGDGVPITEALDVAVSTDTSSNTSTRGLVEMIVVFSADYTQTGSPGTWDAFGDGYSWQWDQTTSTVPSDLGPMSSGNAPDGSSYFYVLDSTSTIWLWSIGEGIYAANGGTVSGIRNSDAVVLWNPDGVGANGAVVGVSPDQQLLLYPQTDEATFGGDGGALYDQVTSLLWAGWPADPVDDGVAWVAQVLNDSNQYEVTFVDATGLVSGLTILDAELAPTDFAVWNIGGLVAMAMADGGVLSITTEYQDASATDLFTIPVPIEQGVQAVYGLPTDAQEATMFVVGVADTLSVLAKDPTLGTWSLTQVQMAAAEAQEMTNWRTQLTILDANSVPVAGVSVTVTPDREIGLWQPSGSFVLTPTSPYTFTTNDHGTITFAIPVLDLESPQLTLQVLDSDGNANGAPLVTTANSGVQQFLAGTGTLNRPGSTLNGVTLTGTTLVNAVSPIDGQPLSPTLAGLSGTDQVNASNAVASTLTQTMNAGLSPNSAGTVQSYLLDLTGPVPTYAWSPDPNDPNTQPSTGDSTGGVGSSAWWDSVKNDIHAIEHSIRHGVTELVQCAAQFVTDVETGVTSWVINLVLDVADFGQQIASFVVTDITSAITAIHGVFAAIGADIDRVVSWIRMALDGLMANVETNAALALTWANELPTQANSWLATLPAIVNGFFLSKESEVNSKLDSIASTLEGITFGQQPPSSGADVGDVFGDAVKILTDVTHNWLLDKLMSEFDEDSQPDTGLDEITAIVTTLLTQIETISETELQTLTSQLWSDLTANLTQASDLKNAALSVLFDAFQAVLDTGLQIADAIVNALISLLQAMVNDVSTFLTMSVDDVPLIGGILDHLGIDDTSSVGHLFTLVAMFPVTFAYQLANDGGQLFPSSSSVGDDPDPDAWEGLNFAHGVLRIIQGGVDTICDLEAVAEEDGTRAVGPLKGSGYFDTVIGFINQAVTWPSVVGKGYAPYQGTPPATDWVDDVNLGKWVAASVWPLFGAASQLCKWQNVGESYTQLTPWIGLGVYGGIDIAGVIVNVEKDATDMAILTGVLEVTPRALDPLLTTYIVDGSGGVSLGVKVFCDVFMEAFAGGLILAGY